jgi:catechol 2,3-dioxygenase-like lactoylglutathione lyase family enzyme
MIFLMVKSLAVDYGQLVCKKRPHNLTMNATGIGQVAITVKDLETAIAFYRDVLGLKFLFKAPPGLAFLRAGDVRVMLAQPEGNGADQSHPTLYFKVADIQAAHADAVGKRASVVDAPHIVANLGTVDLWMFFLRDPDRHLVGIMSEVPAKPRGS